MTVTASRRGRVVVVTIDRPERANAIDLATSRALSAAFDELERDDEVGAVVLTGAGERVFCAGMDLAAVGAGEAHAINGVPGGFAGIVRRDFAKPLVAAVNGAALGGGFEIVLACDLVVAADTARFGLPEVTRGLIAASGGLVRLPSRIPAALALEHILLGDAIPADRARELGLVNRVVPAAEVVPAAVELAERVCAGAPAALHASKRVARTALAAGEAAAWRLSDELASAFTGGGDADAARPDGASAESSR
jgi:enoyl-CoA hydratase